MPVSDGVYPPDTPRQIRLQWRVPAGTATGLVVRELGLVRADGVLVARQTRPPIEITPDMELGDWWILDV